MKDRIRNNLVRQARGLELLAGLLSEEFAYLREGKPREVTPVEFSVHELMRQLAVEREEIRDLLQGRRLRRQLDEIEQRGDMPSEEIAEFRALCASIEDNEQECARQSERNTQLVLALMEQNHGLLEFLQEQMTPKNNDAYAANGRYRAESRPKASLIHGRL